MSGVPTRTNEGWKVAGGEGREGGREERRERERAGNRSILCPRGNADSKTNDTCEALGGATRDMLGDCAQHTTGRESQRTYTA